MNNGQLIIPRWALWVMLGASALGTFMLAWQLGIRRR
jgi:hypothetical protein